MSTLELNLLFQLTRSCEITVFCYHSDLSITFLCSCLYNYKFDMNPETAAYFAEELRFFSLKLHQGHEVWLRPFHSFSLSLSLSLYLMLPLSQKGNYCLPRSLVGSPSVSHTLHHLLNLALFLADCLSASLQLRLSPFPFSYLCPAFLCFASTAGITPLKSLSQKLYWCITQVCVCVCVCACVCGKLVLNR